MLVVLGILQFRCPKKITVLKIGVPKTKGGTLGKSIQCDVPTADDHGRINQIAIGTFFDKFLDKFLFYLFSVQCKFSSVNTPFFGSYLRTNPPLLIGETSTFESWRKAWNVHSRHYNYYMRTVVRAFSTASFTVNAKLRTIVSQTGSTQVLRIFK